MVKSKFFNVVTHSKGHENYFLVVANDETEAVSLCFGDKVMDIKQVNAVESHVVHKHHITKSAHKVKYTKSTAAAEKHSKPSDIKTATVSELGITNEITLAFMCRYVTKDANGVVYTLDMMPTKLSDRWLPDESDELCQKIGNQGSYSPLIQDTPWEECLFKIVES